MYHQLLKIYGRLNLITAHTNLRGGAAAEDGEDGTADDGLPAPEVVFEDVSDEEPEPEDAFAPANDDDDDEIDEGEEEDGDEDGEDEFSEDEDEDDD